MEHLAIPIIALVVIGMAMFSIASSVYEMVGKMSVLPEVQRRDDLPSEIIAALPRDVAAFLESKGFRFAGGYGFHTLRIGIWEQPSQSAPRRLFSFSLSGLGWTSEFITKFSDNDSLTTTRTRAAFMFPRPFGSFLQSFPKASIEQLWDHHERGEQHLISALSIPLKECRLSFVEGFPIGIQRQMSCIKSYPLWPIRGIYWFLLKRFLMLNRPIWTQNVRRLYKKVN